jgi:hypothetical protein
VVFIYHRIDKKEKGGNLWKGKLGEA